MAIKHERIKRKRVNNMSVYKLKSGFKVHELLLKINVDYLFSKNDSEDFYRLLNIEEFGHLSEDNVNKLKRSKSVVIINNDTLQMEVFNIDEDELLQALMEMS